MFSSVELDIMDGLTARWHSQRANVTPHSSLTVPIIQPAEPEVDTPSTSMLKAACTTPLLPPGEIVNIPALHCSSTTPKDNTGTRSLSGLVYSNTSYTRIPSQRDVTDVKLSRSLPDLRDVHNVAEHGGGTNDSNSFEGDKVEKRLKRTESIAYRSDNIVKADSTSIPILTGVGAFGNIASKTTANNLKSHDTDQTSYTQNVHNKTGTIQPSTSDEVTRNSAISNHNTGVMHDTTSADHSKPKQQDADEKSYTWTEKHKACSTSSSEDSDTGCTVKGKDNKKDTKTMSHVNWTKHDVNLVKYTTIDSESVDPRNDLNSDDCSGAVDLVDPDVLTIPNDKSSTGISESSATRQCVQKLSAAEKSEVTSDWQVAVRLHNTPKDMDKEAVTRYLADISAYKLSEVIVRITPIDSDTGTIVVSVKCPTEELQTQFLDAVKLSGHSACAKCQTSTGDRVDNNSGRGTKATIKLLITMACSGVRQEDIDKAVVVAYIKEITGAELADEDLEEDRMNCAATDRCVYRMSCYDKSKANVLTESINEVSDATGMTAAPLTDEDLAIQGLWDEVFSRGCEIVARHHEKLSEVSQDLDKIDSESKSRKTVKDKKRLIDLEEYDRRMGRKKPLISKLKELQSQEVEFNKYMDRLQLQIIDLKGNANLKRAVETLRTEFKLELNRFTSALPMYARKTAIVDTVHNNRVSIILGETGSGKSTQILQYLHEAGFTNEGLVVCTQPRKVAAVSLASRVAQEMGCKVGQLVGYQVGMQVKRSAETKLLYVTDHILLNDCLKDPLFSQYSCLVIDEAHERSIYTDLLLGFIKRSLVGRNDLKVIITSATIDPDIFIRYFDGSPHVVKVSGRAFPVDVIYEEVNCEEDYVEVAVNKSLWVHKTRGPGDVLVFLTSPIETEKACNMLKKYAQQSVIALELNGRLQLEEQQKVFDSTPSEKRKIVFATNSAETSVTIPGIKYVIDTGRIREMNYDAKRNMSVLGLTWTTKSSADQRKGRAGRTDSGYCYRLYTQDTYESMRPNSVPEILRVHLGQAMLKLLMLGIDDPMKFQFVESPKREDIEEALSVLEELGAYDISVGITEIGKKLSLIAVEPRLGKAALRGIEEGVGYEAMVIAAVCSAGGSVFFRAGSAEAKQASDRSKLRFCDEWGDMITGAMIFKEWDQLPTQDRGGWCKVNNINGKTMKFAKDSLKEIMQTFKQDLKLTVAKKFSDDPEVNEVLAKILLECYPSQLARFLGHERIGYCLANDPKQSLHLHPSSSLLYMETPPTWVIYQQILSTTNINKTDIFMTNVTFVDESWIDERLSDGKLKINVDEVLEEVINPEIFAGLGKQCIFRLLDKKGQALRDLEDGITKESSSCEKPRLSIQLDTKRKSIVVYADRHIKQLAKAKVQSFLDEVRHSLRDETIEQPIRKGSNVRFVLGGGLQIKSILMPGEQRQLAIFCSQTQSCRMERVCEVLREYGEIESYTLNSQPNSPVFGYVTFKNAKDAKAAAKDRSMQSGFRVEMSLKDAAAFKSRSANFSMKVEVSRRPLTGFGYVQLHNGDVVDLVLRKKNCLEIRKQIGQSRTVEATIKISSNRRNDDQICLNEIPEWATPCIVKSALQKAIGSLNPGQDLINVVLLRKPPPPPDDSQRLYQLFRGLITQKLISSGEFSTRDFEVQTNEPKDKDFTMSAYLRFEDPDKAVRAAELLDGVGFGSQDIEARLDLKTSFVVPAYVYGNCKQHVEDEIERLNRSSAGVVNVIMDRRKNGSYLIKVETSELEDLKEARAKLDLLLSGHRLDIDSSKYALLKSEAAMRKRDEIEKKARVSIRLDNRQEAVFIYGKRESIEGASRLLDEYLSQTKSSVSKEISLRDGEYPTGIMKTLVGQYGSNLEKLKGICCAFNLELNLKRHVIRFHGTQESYEHLKVLIEESAAQIPGPRLEPEPTPECSACLTSIDYDDCYVLEFCGHYYCSECAKDVVRNGLSNKTIPIRCVLEDCGKDLVLRDFQNLLPRMEEAFDPAIKSFMATCDKEFAYCPTPDCPMIYRKGKNVEEFVCSDCNASICTKCDNAFHPGMMCEIYCSLGY